MNYLLVIDNVAIQDSDRRNEHNEELACVGAQFRFLWDFNLRAVGVGTVWTMDTDVGI